MENKYYVYVLMDSSKPGTYIYDKYIFEYEPFYIGKGCGNRIKNTLHDKSKFKFNKISKLKNENIKIISQKIIENLTNNDSIILEKILIDKIGRRDLNSGVLVNTTDGGDGRVNSKHSLETIHKISKNRTGKGIGWSHSNDTLKIMSERQSGDGNGFYGMTHSQETRDLISIKNSGINHPMYNRRHTKEIREKIKEKRKNLSNGKLREICQTFNKEVYQYSLDMEFLCVYKSVKDASIKTSISESIISKCCRGDILKPTRFFFKYSDSKSKVKENVFFVKEKFMYKKIEYELIKRNRKSAICLNKINNLEETIRYVDCPLLTKKETNDSDFIELYLFLNQFGKFNIDRNNYIIYNDSIIINYIKLHEHQDIYSCVYRENSIDIFENSWVGEKETLKLNIMKL